MGLFTKRDKGRSSAQEPLEPEVPEGEPGVDRAWERAVDGPFDIAERPDPEGYLDFGALRVPRVAGMTLRMDVQAETRHVVGLTCGMGESTVQVQAFAAPRSEGVWDGIRAELAEGIRKAGGALQEQRGLLGTELMTKLPSKGEDEQVVYQSARFYGVDGPKWFLRLVVHGPAATEQDQLRQVVAFARAIVVDRGQEPKPPRELLELTPPPPSRADAGEDDEDDEDPGADTGSGEPS